MVGKKTGQKKSCPVFICSIGGRDVYCRGLSQIIPAGWESIGGYFKNNIINSGITSSSILDYQSEC